MAEKKRHHFIPKFFLRFFSPNETHINLLHVKKGNVVVGASIKEQCAQNNFYGEKAIEDAFERLENIFSQVLKLCHRVGTVKELTKDDLFMLMEAVYFQKSRTLAARERAKNYQETYMRYKIEVLLHKDKELTDSQKEEIRKDIGKDFQLNPLVGHMLEIQTTLMAAFGLIDLGVYILENRGAVPYIFSDAPVIFYNQYYKNVSYMGVLGCQSPGLQIFFPISPGRSIMLIDKKRYLVRDSDNTGVIRVNSDDVAHLNKMQIHNAHQVVYFHDAGCAEYVKRLWKGEAGKLRSNNIIVNEAHSHVERRSLLHAFSPMLVYSPDFSFLSYTPADPAQPVQEIRSVKLTKEVNRLIDEVQAKNEAAIRRNQRRESIRRYVNRFLSAMSGIIKNLWRWKNGVL